IEGERVGLPAPALAPYLVGLLVLLGMLGTFLGMVATLRGTGLALESATDLQAIRASLAAPVKGLGFAFGTSVAGVAASAMLGLLSALCRRDRLRAAQLLDARMATALRGFSAIHQREESLTLMHRQAEGMTIMADRLQAMMSAMEQHQRVLNDGLVASQNVFHAKTETAYTHLAGSVEKSLTESVTESARAAGTAIQPLVESTMADIARETSALHDTIKQAVQQQLDGLTSRFEASTAKMAETWNSALTEHSTSLLRTVSQSQSELQAALVSQDEKRLTVWADTLGASSALLSRQWQEEGERAASRQQEICDAMAQTARDISSSTREHAGSTIAQIAGLVQAASEAPKAAADLVTEVRQVFSESMARDNAMLEERKRLLETVEALLTAVNHASSEQRAAVDSMIEGSADMLDRVGTRFTEKIQTETGRLTDISAQVTGGAIEVASLSEAFGTAVQLFSQSNTALMEQLQGIEATLSKSIARSDEQLAYYVAQAKEVIDLSVMSQKQIIEELQHMADSRSTPGSVTA
ncbi:MAG TPA: hypothetical protein VIR76_02320, partial [Pusillimonas sp.]